MKKIIPKIKFIIIASQSYMQMKYLFSKTIYGVSLVIHHSIFIMGHAEILVLVQNIRNIFQTIFIIAFYKDVNNWFCPNGRNRCASYMANGNFLIYNSFQMLFFLLKPFFP